MDDITTWLIIFGSSLVWGLLHYKAGYYADINKHNKSFKFLEFWRSFLGYFIALLIAYYFVSIRWNYINLGGNLDTGDFVLGLIFLIAVFGWLPYLIKRVTEGAVGISDVIDKKILNK